MMRFFLILLSNQIFASTESLLFDNYNIETIVQVHSYENEDYMSSLNQTKENVSFMKIKSDSCKKTYFNNEINDYDTIEILEEPSTPDSTHIMKTEVVNCDDATVNVCKRKKSFCAYVFSGNRLCFIIATLILAIFVIFVILMNQYYVPKKK
jgi:hypothetical protein